MLRLDFDRHLMLWFRGSLVTCDARLLLVSNSTTYSVDRDGG